VDCIEGCPTAAVMFGVDGVRVLSAERDDVKLRLLVETDQTVAGCPQCGVIAAAHGRGVQVLHDTPFGRRPVRVAWRKRVWRCPERLCPMGTFTEAHELAEPRCRLTRRAVHWATDALAEDDTTVNALAHRLGVDWHTVWEPVKLEARRRLADPSRLSGVCSLGVDEHVWRPGRFGAGREVTCMVDLTRDSSGMVRARLLDLVLGRSGIAYAGVARRSGQDVPGRNQVRRPRPVPWLRQRAARLVVRRGACRCWTPSTS